MALLDYTTYDPARSARENLIDIAIKYNVDVTYLEQSALTKTELNDIKQAEVAALRADPDYQNLGSGEKQPWLDAVREKHDVLASMLRDADRESYKDLWIKAAVERLEVVLIYERADGLTGTYFMRPMNYTVKDTGDLLCGVKIDPEPRGYRTLSSFGVSSFEFTGSKHSEEYNVHQETFDYYDANNLSDIVVIVEHIIFTPTEERLIEEEYGTLRVFTFYEDLGISTDIPDTAPPAFLLVFDDRVWGIGSPWDVLDVLEHMFQMMVARCTTMAFHDFSGWRDSMSDLWGWYLRMAHVLPVENYWRAKRKLGVVNFMPDLMAADLCFYIKSNGLFEEMVYNCQPLLGWMCVRDPVYDPPGDITSALRIVKDTHWCYITLFHLLVDDVWA